MTTDQLKTLADAHGGPRAFHNALRPIMGRHRTDWLDFLAMYRGEADVSERLALHVERFCAIHVDEPEPEANDLLDPSPYKTGGGWYDIPGVGKVQGEARAREALEALWSDENDP